MSVCVHVCVCVQGSLHAQPCRQPRCYSRYFSRLGQALRRGGCHSAGPHQPTRSPAGAQGRGGPGGCAREGVGTLLAGVLGGTASLQGLEGQQPGFAAGRWLHLQDMALARSPAGWGLRVPLASTAGGDGRPSRAQRSGGLLCSWGGLRHPPTKTWRGGTVAGGCTGCWVPG